MFVLVGLHLFMTIDLLLEFSITLKQIFNQRKLNIQETHSDYSEISLREEDLPSSKNFSSDQQSQQKKINNNKLGQLVNQKVQGITQQGEPEFYDSYLD